MRLPWLTLPALLLLATLAACADQPACGLTLAADLSLASSGGRPMIAAEIAGQPVKLVIDTGLTGLALTQPAIARLHLAHDMSRAVAMSGVGGSSRSFPAIATGLRLVGQHGHIAALPEMRAAVLPNPEASPAGPGADGLLGMAVLRQFDIDLDVPHHRVALYRGRPCGNVPLPMPGPATALETAITQNTQHLALRVDLDGKPRLAMLDTGARRSLVTERAAALPARVLAADPVITLTGVGPATATARLHSFAALEIGSDHMTAPDLIVLDDPMLDFDVVLGMDYMRLRRLFISFSTNRLYIQRPPPH